MTVVKQKKKSSIFASKINLFALIVDFTIGIMHLIGADWHQQKLKLNLIDIFLDLLNLFISFKKKNYLKLISLLETLF